jgi:hypothetical protein
LTFITIKDIEPIVDRHQFRVSRAHAKLRNRHLCLSSKLAVQADLVAMGDYALRRIDPIGRKSS